MICHMMMSIDGRIDCGMTVKIAGSNEYYETLNALNVPTTLIGGTNLRGILQNRQQRSEKRASQRRGMRNSPSQTAAHRPAADRPRLRQGHNCCFCSPRCAGRSWLVSFQNAPAQNLLHQNSRWQLHGSYRTYSWQRLP